MNTLVEKLRAIGGDGKLAECEWRIRSRCGWHHKAQSAIRHLIYSERRATVEEAKQIEAAHLRWCAEKIDANRRENAQLFDTMRKAIAAMEASDPEFYGPQIQAIGELLLRCCDLGKPKGRADRS